MTIKIKKAVFPVAGFGTRFLPATKAIPKEMLPLADKPVIQYGVEEASKAKIEEVIFVTGMGKDAIANHFDTNVELENLLKEKKDLKRLKEIKKISSMAHYSYTRQPKPLGLGHAVLCAKNIVGNEPFALFLGDEIINTKIPAIKELIKAFEKKNATILAVKRVPKKETSKYGIIKAAKTKEGLYKVTDLVEKPKKNPPSNMAIIGRYILTPGIFKSLEKTKKGAGGEIQLTDGIKNLLKTEEVFAVEITGERFDCGDKLGFLTASLTFGLKNNDIKEGLKKFVKSIK